MVVSYQGSFMIGEKIPVNYFIKFHCKQNPVVINVIEIL